MGKEIRWDNIVGIVFLLIIFIGIACGLVDKYTEKKKASVYSIDIHDGDSVVVYKNHYKK